MTTLLITHADCKQHAPPARHPESPARLRAVIDALSHGQFSDLERLQAVPATAEHLLRIHPQSHIDAVMAAVPADGYTFVDEDTVMSPGTAHAALLAAGAGVQAVDQVMSGAVKNAFCAIRPPGHHAEPERAMGFCFFSNAAIAARHAQVSHGARRVAVVDFDVHHGNGTQAAFINDATLFYASTHQHPLYPGTGDAATTGIAGNIVNAPLPPHANGEMFRAAYQDRILPALDAFAPDLIVISAGFDGHRRDPLAQMDLEDEDYAWITQQLCKTAHRHCEGRVISLLEGGYDLKALASASGAHVAALMAA
ncbi:histone deacetylase family protein [Pyruvatibacter sp.]|uniref:histone deacetylase family protein n=1 Tax=Pyruvatibacter sp. TaxID=1981328 RepID=UPI0032EF48ED